MITYKRRQNPGNFLSHIFQMQGSVFPSSFAAAFPCAIATLVLKLFMNKGFYLPFHDTDILENSAIWSGFNVLVAFLVVFRTSQAYTRFWDGTTAMVRMRAEWFDACCAVISFCKYSKASAESTRDFKHGVTRLFSMLHAVALAEIEDSNSDEIADIQAFKFELLDVDSIDRETLQALKYADAKVELVYQWVQQLIVENIETGVLAIPAPLLARVFNEAANGMVQFHEALKISRIPFPFPYAQACDCLLLLHLLVTPFLVAQWVTEEFWAVVFAFIQVFILWCLRHIALEIENPYGHDDNDLDACEMHSEFNVQLRVLNSKVGERTPRSATPTKAKRGSRLKAGTSFYHVWKDLDNEDLAITRSFRSNRSIPLELSGSCTRRCLGRCSGALCGCLRRPGSRPRERSPIQVYSRNTSTSSSSVDTAGLNNGSGISLNAPERPRVAINSVEERALCSSGASQVRFGSEEGDAPAAVSSGEDRETWPAAVSSEGGTETWPEEDEETRPDGSGEPQQARPDDDREQPPASQPREEVDSPCAGQEWDATRPTTLIS